MRILNLTRRGLAAALLHAACALGLLAATTSPAQAQAYPSRPIHFIVPFAPGGGTDIIARQYAEQLSRRLGQPVVVENRPGAATNIAGQALLAAEPNGYTLLMGTSQMGVNAVLGPKPPFDPLTAFAPVAMVAELPFALAVDARSPIASVRDFVASARGREITVASAQFDNQVKLLSGALATPLLSVPFKGGAESITAVLAGEVTGVLAGASAIMGQVKAGKLRALGVSSAHRSKALPDVPTFTEQGFPAFAVGAWLSVLAPKGTPEAIVRQLADATRAIAADAAFEQRLIGLAADPVLGGPAETLARLRAELQIWQTLAR